MAALAVGLLALEAAQAGESAGDLARAFCAARVKDDEAATRKLLTPSLLKEIAEAERRNDIVAKASPDDKPPLGDGIPYQAFPDVVESCAPGKAAVVSGRAEAAVVYQFAGAADSGWTDRLVLAEEGGRLLVDDIVYANMANGAQDLSLRQVLLSAFDQ